MFSNDKRILLIFPSPIIIHHVVLDSKSAVIIHGSIPQNFKLKWGYVAGGIPRSVVVSQEMARKLD